MTDDIVAFIKIRLQEDQMSALDALKHWPPGDEIAGQVDSILVGEHINRQNPHRTLHGVEAKRRLITEFENAYREDTAAGLGLALRIAALEWSTHEDYRSEWTP